MQVGLVQEVSHAGLPSQSRSLSQFDPGASGVGSSAPLPLRVPPSPAGPHARTTFIVLMLAGPTVVTRLAPSFGLGVSTASVAWRKQPLPSVYCASGAIA